MTKTQGKQEDHLITDIKLLGSVHVGQAII